MKMSGFLLLKCLHWFYHCNLDKYKIEYAFKFHTMRDIVDVDVNQL
jgi:hypothetical protein